MIVPQLTSLDYGSSYNVIDAINEASLCLQFENYLKRQETSIYSNDVEKQMFQLIRNFLRNRSLAQINRAIAVVSYQASEPAIKSAIIKEVSNNVRTSDGTVVNESSA